MNAIDILKKEHEAVEQSIHLLKRIVQQVDIAGKIIHPEHLTQLLDFFRTFVDRCHHAKEETLLFPALEAIGVSREGGPLGLMLKEHDQGRNLVARMDAAVTRYLDGDNAAVSDFVGLANDYIRLLSAHIQKENDVIFQLAMQHLSENRLNELENGFDRIEREEIGDAKHDALHGLLVELKHQYD